MCKPDLKLEIVMNYKTKRKIKKRMETIISKIDELKQLGHEDSEINDIIPSSLEGFEQDLIEVAYTEL